MGSQERRFLQLNSHQEPAESSLHTSSTYLPYTCHHPALLLLHLLPRIPHSVELRLAITDAHHIFPALPRAVSVADDFLHGRLAAQVGPTGPRMKLWSIHSYLRFTGIGLCILCELCSYDNGPDWKQQCLLSTSFHITQWSLSYQNKGAKRWNQLCAQHLASRALATTPQVAWQGHISISPRPQQICLLFAVEQSNLSCLLYWGS